MNAPIRILLVDDEPGFTDVLARRLVRRGMAVDTAQDGAEALALVQSAHFDAAVVDLLMPGVDGVQVLKVMKKLRPRLAVILLTGHGTVHDAIHAAEAGAFEFLSKPVELDELEATIRRALHPGAPRRGVSDGQGTS